MNIHEHQAKEILKKYGAIVPEGVFAFTVEDLIEKAKKLKIWNLLKNSYEKKEEVEGKIISKIKSELITYLVINFI